MKTDEVSVVKAIYMKENNLLSTGSKQLDLFLRGGLESRGIVELTGESGCGKSQLCKQLTLTVQYPLSQGGLNGGAIYICTEERFQSRRLYELIEKFPRQYYKNNDNHHEIDFGNNILVVHVDDYENLEKCLRSIPNVAEGKNIKLIIIDSITAVFRGNYTPSEGQKRVRELRCIGHILHKLSVEHNFAIVCVNQVSQLIIEQETVPALGLAWANLVTSRFLLSRNGETRQLQVVYSPELPSKITANFTIQACGITN